MKNLIQKTSKLLAGIFLITLTFMACETNPEVEPQADILPENFGIDIPSTISNQGNASGRIAGNTAGRTQEDVLQGNDIYQHLEVFIHVGESAKDIVRNIINGIRKYNIDKAFTLSIESDDDGRVKNIVVVESPEFEGETYEYGLTMTDAESEGNEDGGYALQIFWNRSPVKGTAIIKPYNIDRLHDANTGEAVFRVDYDAASTLGYDAHMIVSIANLTLEDPSLNVYSMRSLKMFVGKSGNIIDVYGNSNHPNAKFFTDDSGFNWAFVASGYNDADYAVAEVGLPPSTLDETSRAVLLETYSIKNVFTEQINIAFPGITQDQIDLYLMHAEGPGYFTNEGFVSGGIPPAGLWDELELRIEDLTPYNPVEISNLQVSFQ
ncbi:MAG: hypothetical protein ABFS32_10420 [Bacteroidota bacterium]